jgi:hypothetical protein
MGATTVKFDCGVIAPVRLSPLTARRGLQHQPLANVSPPGWCRPVLSKAISTHGRVNRISVGNYFGLAHELFEPRSLC